MKTKLFFDEPFEHEEKEYLLDLEVFTYEDEGIISVDTFNITKCICNDVGVPCPDELKDYVKYWLNYEADLE